MEKIRSEKLKRKFEQMLGEIKEFLAEKLSFENITFDGDITDQADIERLKSLDTKLLWRKTLFANKIQEAILKIDSGTYGTCEDCGAQIDEARLLARPTTQFCIACKEDQEQVENHILYSHKSHTSGQMIKSDLSTLNIVEAS